MTLSNDSIVIVPSEGATVASHSVSSKELQIMIPADHNGVVNKSEKVFYGSWYVNNNSVAQYDLFNGSSSDVLRVVSVKFKIRLAALITGISTKMRLVRTSAAGTGGTTFQLRPMVVANSLPSGVTTYGARTGLPTIVTDLMTYWQNNDESNASAYLTGVIAGNKDWDLIPWTLRNNKKGIVLRPGEGFAIIRDTATTTGFTNYQIKVVVD